MLDETGQLGRVDPDRHDPAPTFDAGICGPRINGRMIWSLIRLAVVPKAMPNGSAWAGQVEFAAAPIVALPAEFSPVDKGAC